MDPNAPVHPKLPFGLGSQVALTGVLGAVAVFIGSLIDAGLQDPATIAYGITAAGAVAAFFGGRSYQARGAIEQNIGRLQDVIKAYQKYVAAGAVTPGGDQPGIPLPGDPAIPTPAPDEGTTPGPGTQG